ncbi:hypothetical protein Cni_G29133 [Canna indica]|uniref:WRKY domain-containing protein n=1 Tax=Canna indica TaxID=4628 RepID=A0AAQ3L455_9LILI|nr:hypothetical protein Cni_G29133 [Canna indica]
MSSAPSSIAEKPIAIKAKTVRLNLISSFDSSPKVASFTDGVSESIPSYSSEKLTMAALRPESKPNYLYKPTAKAISRATASLLANLGNINSIQQQVVTSNQLPIQVMEQVKPNYLTHQQNSSSQSDMNETYNEASNLMPQNSDLSTRNQQLTGQDRPSYDGYNWRKYGQKQVKGSEYPRSYYKCTNPTCPVKKKVERSFDGQIAEIVYKGEHNHPKPQPPKRQPSSSQEQGYATEDHGREAGHPSWNNSVLLEASAGGIDSLKEASLCGLPTYAAQVQFPHDPLIGAVYDCNANNTNSSGIQVFTVPSRAVILDHDKSDFKRRRHEDQVSGINSVGEPSTEPHSVMQTSMESDISGDGYHWRKYGQKVVKGNTYPRSYYKCTNPKCSVRKYVERASDESGCFVTTYEGKHNHEMPVRKTNFVASN